MHKLQYSEFQAHVDKCSALIKFQAHVDGSALIKAGT